ncbi:DMT family transporter [Ureibacillus sp. FSL K6-8385]|uniref:DMT family transporter n=1 Tax=Ureibacillus terrenus TaxID=118246 RepID=A0A540V390_9BACL|nr:DMT family transporter [Ureibacillus terrenus]MED3662173.1 DMT family transporter [Ureibacillus terrenus]MED3763653.1 DMT family transporter [Ureibacillus terrenus]TQE91212.1 DMT family transporter [Ureibacillus terrenus]
MKRYIGEIMLLTTAIIWGSGFAFSAISLDYFTPYQILAVRFTVGVLILSVIFFPRVKRLKKPTIKRGFILGFLLYSAFLLQTVGLQYTTPSKNAFITAINVVIVPFIAFFLDKRKVDKFELAGAFLAIIGIAFLSLELSIAEINMGDLLTFGCAVGFAYQIYYTSKYVKDEDPILLTVVQMGAAALFAWMFVMVKGEIHFALEWKGILSILYLGSFSTALAYCFQTMAQKYTGETKTAIILSTEALWGMIFSIIILNEVLTGRMIIGAALILTAIILAETKPDFLRGKSVEDVRQIK